MSLFTAAQNATLLQKTGGVTVVYDGTTTYGHEKVEPWMVPGEVTGSGTISGNRSVVIAAGILPGIDYKSGIGERIVVNGTGRRIRFIDQGERGGEASDSGLLELFLADD